MSEKEIPAEKAPATAPKERAATGPKVWKYIGPAKAPFISNLPGISRGYHADELPQQYIPFVLETIPAAQYWYE